jgi:hypothetical protein
MTSHIHLQNSKTEVILVLGFFVFIENLLPSLVILDRSEKLLVVSNLHFQLYLAETSPGENFFL